jgi:hypothetical protein
MYFRFYAWQKMIHAHRYTRFHPARPAGSRDRQIIGVRVFEGFKLLRSNLGFEAGLLVRLDHGTGSNRESGRHSRSFGRRRVA